MNANRVPAASERWGQGPLHPRLPEGVVQVWRANLQTAPTGLAGLLSREEHARAGRILRERDRELWMRAHGVLRSLLGRYAERDPRSFGFRTGPHGKPALLEDAPGSGAAPQQASRHPSPAPQAGSLAFSMSHSAATALYAFTRTGDIGVDVEVQRRPIDAVAIATRTFGPTEARRLEGLQPADCEREFLRSWVRHEATLKYVGSGIGGPPGDGPEPWVADLGMDSGMAAAVAVAECPHELRCWEWPSRGASPSS